MIPEKICLCDSRLPMPCEDGDRGVEGKPGKPIIS